MDQFRDLAVEVLHAFVRAGFHGIEQGLVLALAFFDALAGARIGFKNLDHRDAAVAPRLGQEALANDVAERFSEPFAHGLLLVGRKGTDDALDGLGSVHGIEARQNQVPRLRRLQYDFDGLAVAHLTHQNDLGRLPQGRAQGVGKARSIAVQLPLVNGGTLVIVQKFDGIFDGDDVVILFAIDAVEQYGQSGRLSRPSRPRDQNDAVAQLRHIP